MCFVEKFGDWIFGGGTGHADGRSVRQSVFQYETTRVAGRFGNSTPPAIKPPRVGGKFCGQTTNDEPRPTDATLSRPFSFLLDCNTMAAAAAAITRNHTQRGKGKRGASPTLYCGLIGMMQCRVRMPT